MTTDGTLFEKSRRRIIAAIMAVLATLFIATLVAIYAFSYIEVYDRNARMLEDYAAGYQTNRLPPGFAHPDASADRDLDQARQSAPFYAVLFDTTSVVVAVENANASSYDSAELVSRAIDAIDTGRRSGLLGPLMFAVERAPSYTLVAFMDNTLVTESMGTLFRYTLIVGLVLLVMLFFVARWIAGRIVRPMQQAYEAQRRFISDAGHELKTPVAIIEANAELLKRELGDNPWLENVRYENGRMGALVTQLLALARSEESSPRRERVDLSHVVQAEALSSEPLAFERDMEFGSAIEKGVEVMGDPSQLAQLVAILLDNALSHARADAPVEIILAQANGTARLSVQNGIAAGDVVQLRDGALFERFARGDTARTDGDARATTHYGLGLAIARTIAESHRGSIDAMVDEGALMVTFVVTLPTA